MENLPESLPEQDSSPPDEPKSIPVLAKTEQTRAHKLDREIVEDIKEIQRRFKHLAKNLAEMHRRRLYFAFGFFSFEEYCRKRLGQSRQYIYKIIQAHDFLKFLEDQGVSDEDTDSLTERLLREIRALPQSKQVRVAKEVARIKRQTGRTATIIEVHAEAAKIDGEGQAHNKARKVSKYVKEETSLELQRRSLAMMSGKKIGISREEFDPDFKGTSMEFVDKYGHVQLVTKAELEEANDRAAFSAWVAAIRSLKTPLSKFLEGATFKPENFDRWIKKAKSPEARVAEVKELFSLIVQTKESIDRLLQRHQANKD